MRWSHTHTTGGGRAFCGRLCAGCRPEAQSPKYIGSRSDALAPLLLEICIPIWYAYTSHESMRHGARAHVPGGSQRAVYGADLVKRAREGAGSGPGRCAPRRLHR